MITSNKARVLLMFAHSRLSLKMSGNVAGNIENVGIQNQLIDMKTGLEKDNFTIDYLNAMPPSQLASQLTFYYEKLLNEFSKHIKKDDEIIEDIIGLNIMVHLVENRHVVKSDENLANIINSFSKLTKKEDRALVMKMRIIAQRLIKSLESVNYTRYLKQMRKQRGRR
jgi:hypothetical protein